MDVQSCVITLKTGRQFGQFIVNFIEKSYQFGNFISHYALHTK